MSEQIEREVRVPAPVQDVWDAVVGDGWLADEVEFDLRPGGDAAFRWNDALVEKTGWVEDVLTPDDRGAGRLAFWWTAGDQPATRVEVTIAPDDGFGSWVRVVESRPLDRLDLIGTPLPGAGGTTTYGPALVAALA